MSTSITATNNPSAVPVKVSPELPSPVDEKNTVEHEQNTLERVQNTTKAVEPASLCAFAFETTAPPEVLTPSADSHATTMRRWVRTLGSSGKVMRIEVDEQWSSNSADDWWRSTEHFGILIGGKIVINFGQRTVTVNAGEVYCAPKSTTLEVQTSAVMMEFQSLNKVGERSQRKERGEQRLSTVGKKLLADYYESAVVDTVAAPASPNGEFYSPSVLKVSNKWRSAALGGARGKDNRKNTIQSAPSSTVLGGGGGSLASSGDPRFASMGSSSPANNMVSVNRRSLAKILLDSKQKVEPEEEEKESRRQIRSAGYGYAPITTTLNGIAPYVIPPKSLIGRKRAGSHRRSLLAVSAPVIKAR